MSLKRVAALARAQQRVRGKLHEAVAEARAEGATLQQIGDAAGLTRQRIWQLLNGKDGPQ
jgi:hypothetical protein